MDSAPWGRVAINFNVRETQMGNADQQPGQDRLDGNLAAQSSEAPRKPVADAVDIRALLLDPANPDLERLLNLMMMC